MRTLLATAAALLAGPALAQPQALPCQSGQVVLPDVGVFPCEGVDLIGYLPVSAFATPGSPAADEHNDIWGWTDPETGTEYALVGTLNGVGFVDLSEPHAPRLVGKLPSASTPSVWRDVKVYADHAFVVADFSSGHGMQVFDLTRLRSASGDPVTFEADARYTGFGSAHNVVVNEATGFAYGVGSAPSQDMPASCSPRGFHAVDVRDPKAPTFAGCFSDVEMETGNRSPGYTHDAQCVVYEGPDEAYRGRELCFGANEDVVTVFDATDKQNVRVVSQASYPLPAYTHQGWLTDDHRYFLANDELDELNGFVATQRTIVIDFLDLDDPEAAFVYDSGLTTIDHNLYVHNGYAYESNYESGLRILDLAQVGSGTLEEVAFFDTYPDRDGTAFNGAWSVYPFFESGLVVVNDINSGLFVLRPTALRPLSGQPETPSAGAVLSEPAPHPASGRTVVTLTAPATGDVEADLYDVAGRRVRTVYAGAASGGRPLDLVVETADLPAGVYVLHVRGASFVASRRVVVAR